MHDDTGTRTDEEGSPRRVIFLWAIVLAKEELLALATPVLPSVFHDDNPEASVGGGQPVEDLGPTEVLTSAGITEVSLSR